MSKSPLIWRSKEASLALSPLFAGIYLIFENSAFEDIAINFFRAILLLFVGGNLLLYKKWAWWLAIILIGFMVLQFSVGTYLTIIKPIFTPNHSGVGVLRWIILILNPIVIMLFYYLLLSSTREKFNKTT